MTYETLRVERDGRVATVTLNRPDALNALNTMLVTELLDALEELDADTGVGAIVLTGSDRAFAAGADIKEMAQLGYADLAVREPFAALSRIPAIRTPLIAAVAGFALGGGCELAMACDLIVAAENAQFGQPEITLGVIPGLGGTQRLTRAVGKAKAMDLILTGRRMDAAEAERSGLVARVVPADELLPTAQAMAATIAGMSLPVVYAAKEAVNVALETPLAEGLRFERRSFASMFALDDQTEGMTAFVEKRRPEFGHR
ncbi:enoyl-CoA hydratase [Pseudolysinimonas sp.]|uniref:enoyl-CoA hydratase n=1 Tax=Pseudolysinimonas sp. TaxID=2680009 RepID=UPI003F810E84